MNVNTKFRFSSILLFFEAHLKLSLLILLLGVFSIGCYPFVSSDYSNYSLGDVALEDVKASASFCFEDENMTDASIGKLLLESPIVYDFDVSVQSQIISKVKIAFKNQINFKSGVKFHNFEKKVKTLEKKNSKDISELSKEEVDLRRKLFSEELGIFVSDSAYKVLEEYKFAEYIPEFINSVLLKILSNGVIFDKVSLLRESYRGIILKNSKDNSEKHIWDLKTFYGIDQAKVMVKIIATPLFKDLNYSLLNLIIDFSQRLLEPNIIPNIQETNRRRNLVFESIIPKFYFVKAGEIIIKKGEIIDQDHLIKLKFLDDNLVYNLFSYIGQLLILTMILVVYSTVQLKPYLEAKKLFNKDLILITTIIIIEFIIIKIWPTFINTRYFNFPLTEDYLFTIRFGIPLAVGSMIVCLVIGTEVAFSFALFSAVLAAMLLPNKFEHFICFFLSEAMAVWWVKGSRERGTIIKAGAKLGVFCIFISIMINIYFLDSFEWDTLIFDIIISFVGGLTSGIIVVGMLPLFEILFSYTTNSRLFELSNLDGPILRRLMLEAPGTYHHSMVVGSMVEAAASEIGANSLLGKVCGYYHDIGKLKQPLYFIENQLDHRNRHDKLSPSMSSLILMSHVKHGIEIAKDHNLGKAIIDVIKQHHGKSLISYFFEKARQIKGDENINFSDFRYPGPIPQTVEAGLVMLADVVEAASRTLVNPTPSRIQGLVQNFINKIFSDGQLDNCNLTLKDLNSIAKSFNKILSGIYHHRVEYHNFSYASIIDGKLINGDINKQQTESLSTTNKKNLSDSSNSLKRLGLS